MPTERSATRRVAHTRSGIARRGVEREKVRPFRVPFFFFFFCRGRLLCDKRAKNRQERSQSVRSETLKLRKSAISSTHNAAIQTATQTCSRTQNATTATSVCQPLTFILLPPAVITPRPSSKNSSSAITKLLAFPAMSTLHLACVCVNVRVRMRMRGCAAVSLSIRRSVGRLRWSVGPVGLLVRWSVKFRWFGHVVGSVGRSGPPVD